MFGAKWCYAMRVVEDGYFSKCFIWVMILAGVGVCGLASWISSYWIALIGLIIGSIGGGAAQARALGIRSFKVNTNSIDGLE